ncbi:MAG: class I SAM-dependent methyltransferase [Gemmatimonadota bacterium]|nr:MAG: class I SAM-dependent methyltransferase [Gemmatimonadota bacterium]
MRSEDFWESDEQVETFASRPPDQRLLELLGQFERPREVRVLDLGCAGGRNAVVLAERGFDFYAIDSSRAMVDKTRARVADVLGAAEAERRVNLGRMEDLAQFESEAFNLVVALGVFHSAGGRRAWEQALGETARLLAPGGQLLVANLSPRSDPGRTGLRRAAETDYVYEGFDAGPLFLLEAEELDAEFSRFGLQPIEPTRTVSTPTEAGQRVTVNGLYRRVT